MDNEELRIESGGTISTWQNVRRLFEEAVALPVDERVAFVRSHCSDEVVLREVESLLEHERQSDQDFMRLPQPDPMVDEHLTREDRDPLIGQTIAAYTIKSRIARGGMGTVYLAEQANPSRKVALKVMHSGAWSAAAAKRFDVESRILAYLRHPNIAQVYEAGTHRLEGGTTVRFFSMEFVPEARTIIRYANDRALSLKHRLELFLQLCDAVQHGHQKGIIHRDLKPANILVDAEGRVKVIDFGVARSTDSDIAVTSMHTEVGQILGTLAYMSPEQCAADPSQIDTTTDVYSLGVILFELLTARMPYDVSNMTILSASRVICEKEPARPSVFDRRLRGDVETIILKAIEKDRSKRYAGVADLAADIRRYLNGEPISARPPTAWSKALRWAARRPKTATAVSCLIIVSIIAVATATGLYLIGLKPDHVGLVADESEARLLTIGNKVLHRWHAGGPGRIRGAAMEFEPTQLGRRRLAIIGFTCDSKLLSGSLAAFDVDADPSVSVWQNRVEPAQLPFDSDRRRPLGEKAKEREERDLRNRGPTFWDFGVSCLLAADVFAESPGNEVVAVFANCRSQRAIRIYGITGNLLYQVWQDGGIQDVYWMGGPRLLVCAGLDERTKGVQVGDKDLVHRAAVVFALRPDWRVVLRDYVDSESIENTKRPIWYRYIHPGIAGSGNSFRLTFSSGTGALDAERHVGLNLGLRHEDRGIGALDMVLDERGEVVQKSLAPDDTFEQYPDELCEFEKEFRLGDTPPTSVWSSATSPTAPP